MSLHLLKISYYDYVLPKYLIAQHPTPERDESRLLVLHRKNSRIEHRKFHEITEYLNCGDVLVLNDTKVIPAKIVGSKTTGGKIEALIIKEIEDGIWEMLLKSNSKPKENETLHFNDNSLKGRVVRHNENGSFTVEFKNGKKFKDVLKNTGSMPLPPYIKRDNKSLTILDEKRYQTVYAKKIGAIAAPTAGLHFTHNLLERIANKGVKIAYLTLHVGLGTFTPIREEYFTHHKMHKEFYFIPQNTIDMINKTKSIGGRVIATGTTTCRALETIARNGAIKESAGWTSLFIYPPYKFGITDSLITNFHLQRTSLILLVSAFAGRKNILRAYETAINLRYRFYSYGDCMLIL